MTEDISTWLMAIGVPAFIGSLLYCGVLAFLIFDEMDVDGKIHLPLIAQVFFPMYHLISGKTFRTKLNLFGQLVSIILTIPASIIFGAFYIIIVFLKFIFCFKTNQSRMNSKDDSDISMF